MTITHAPKQQIGILVILFPFFLGGGETFFPRLLRIDTKKDGEAGALLSLPSCGKTSLPVLSPNEHPHLRTAPKKRKHTQTFVGSGIIKLPILGGSNNANI